MPTQYETICTRLRGSPAKWLVTGAAGFIGSHLVDTLLDLDQDVVGLDNFATGQKKNLEQVRASVTGEQWERFRFMEGDIRDLKTCVAASDGIQYVLHHAALASVPASLENPNTTHEINVTGFLNILNAGRARNVRRVVYASSSAVYGDDETLPKVESTIGQPLSPYAFSKYADELYAANFQRWYGVNSVGLRYFNIFGTRQDPRGAYAAVIPKWIEAMIKGEEVFINGDGETTRDFCHVANVVQANLLAATAENPEAVNQVYNIGLGRPTTLSELFRMIRSELGHRVPALKKVEAKHREFRAGDIRHSHADITRAQKLLGYAPTMDLKAGLASAMDWYVRQYSGR